VEAYRSRLEEILRELPRLPEVLSTRRSVFVRKKKEELDQALSSNPNEAAMLLLTLRRALESGEPDEEARALLAELETRYRPLLGSDPQA
jgi:hypothetical protein